MAKLDETVTMLKDLTDARGIPGSEKEPREVMDRYIRPYADEIVQDNLGSLIAKKVGDENGPKIMVSGHLDEVGFMVTRIDDNGFIYFQTVGGWWSQVMSAQRVTIMTKKGDVTGVFGSVPPPVLPPEERKKPIEMKDMFIDIGALDKAEAEAAGVAPGDAIVPDSNFTQLINEKMLMAKAWDNRIGCAIAINVMKELKTEHHPNIVYSTGTVQEELGLRGARTAAHLIKPDIGFSVDVGFAGDTPNISEKYAASKLGKGPEITLIDASMVAHRGMLDYIIDTANKHNIPFQYSAALVGKTDAGEIHLSFDGVPSLAIGIPTRYMHTHATILHRDDFENAVKLIVNAIKGLDNNKLSEIKLR